MCRGCRPRARAAGARHRQTDIPKQLPAPGRWPVHPRRITGQIRRFQARSSRHETPPAPSRDAATPAKTRLSRAIDFSPQGASTGRLRRSESHLAYKVDQGATTAHRHLPCPWRSAPSRSRCSPMVLAPVRTRAPVNSALGVLRSARQRSCRAVPAGRRARSLRARRSRSPRLVRNRRRGSRGRARGAQRARAPTRAG